MPDIFDFHKNVLENFALFSRSFSTIRAEDIKKTVNADFTYHYLKQFLVLPPTTYSQNDIDYIVPRVLELTYTAIDLIPFAEDL